MKSWLIAAALIVSLGGCARPNNGAPPVPAATPRPTPDSRYSKGAETAASYAKIRVEKAKTRAELDSFWKGFDASLVRLRSKKNAKAQSETIGFYMQPVKEFSATRRQALPK